MDGENNGKPLLEWGWFGGKHHYFRKHPHWRFWFFWGLVFSSHLTFSALWRITKRCLFWDALATFGWFPNIGSTEANIRLPISIDKMHLTSLFSLDLSIKFWHETMRSLKVSPKNPEAHFWSQQFSGETFHSIFWSSFFHRPWWYWGFTLIQNPGILRTRPAMIGHVEKSNMDCEPIYVDGSEIPSNQPPGMCI